jgi:hypothetical protein
MPIATPSPPPLPSVPPVAPVAPVDVAPVPGAPAPAPPNTISGSGSVPAGVNGVAPGPGTTGPSPPRPAHGPTSVGVSGPAGGAPARPSAPAVGGGSPAAPSAARRRAVQIRKRERRLRRLVERSAGCLPSVPRAERRVLELRAALDRPRTTSRRAVATSLDVTLRRVTILERRGTRLLRRLARLAACDNAATTDTSAASGLVDDGARSGDSATTVGSTDADQAAATGDDSSRGDVQGAAASSDPTRLPATLTLPDERPLDVTTYLAVGAFLLLLAAGLFATRLRTRRAFLRYYAD